MTLDARELALIDTKSAFKRVFGLGATLGSVFGFETEGGSDRLDFTDELTPKLAPTLKTEEAGLATIGKNLTASVPVCSLPAAN
jgi:hypothetical protein